MKLFSRFRKKTTPIGITLIQFFNNPRKKAAPVFVIGCGRSGTTMLIRSLEKSIQIKLYNEDHSDAFEKWRIKDIGTIHKLVNSGFAPIKLFKPILDSHMALDYLSQFSSAKILFIFRHYGDVINSSIKRFGADNWPTRVQKWVEADFEEFGSAPPPERLKEYIRSKWNNDLSAASSIALYWLFYNNLYYDLGLVHNPSVYCLNYETLVRQPEIEFRKVCAFINIKFSPKMTDQIFASSIRREAPPLIDSEIKKDCDDLWQKLVEKARENSK